MLVCQTSISTVAFVPTPDMFRGDFTPCASAVCQSGHPLTLRGRFVNNQVDPVLSAAAVNIAKGLPQDQGREEEVFAPGHYT
jgi:hypothetical protein